MTQAAEKSFEVAMKELEGIVRKLEGGNVELEQAIKDYAAGMELKDICEKKLADAKLMVEKVVAKGDAVTTEPLNQAAQ